MAAASLAGLLAGEPSRLAVAETDTRGDVVRCISFGALERLVRRLTRAIRTACGPQPVQPLIALIASLSAESIAAILAIWRAGGVYMPLESTPLRRVLHLLSRTNPAVALCDTESFSRLAATLGPSHAIGAGQLHRPIPSLDVADGHYLGVISAISISAQKPGNGQVPIPPDVAYILFTSGSTGEPKGVLGTARGLLARLHWGWKAFPYDEHGPSRLMNGVGELCACKTALTFVDSLAEILAPLGRGVPVLVLSRELVRMRPLDMWRALQVHGVTRITMVPTALRMLLDGLVLGVDGQPASSTAPYHLPSLRVLSLSGEPLPLTLAHHAASLLPLAQVLNLYGCTEVSADVTCFCVGGRAEAEASVLGMQGGVWAEHTSRVAAATCPLGAPICGASIRLVASTPSGHESDVCLGQIKTIRPTDTADGQSAVGEIYVSGDVLAAGYLDEVNHPTTDLPRFVDEYGVRWFRTGDLGRWGGDGELLFEGRADEQVKVRGVRVHPFEVEATLLAGLPFLKHAVALQAEGDDSATQSIGAGHLVLICTLHENFDERSYGAAVHRTHADWRGGETGRGPATCNDFVASKTSAETARLLFKLRRAAIELLPEALRPSRWLVVSSLPCLASGKVDRVTLRTQLPILLREQLAQQDYTSDSGRFINFSPLEIRSGAREASRLSKIETPHAPDGGAACSARLPLERTSVDATLGPEDIDDLNRTPDATSAAVVGVPVPYNRPDEALLQLLCSVLGRLLGLGRPLARSECLADLGLTSVLAVRAAYEMQSLDPGSSWDATYFLGEGRLCEMVGLARRRRGQKRTAEAQRADASVDAKAAPRPHLVVSEEAANVIHMIITVSAIGEERSLMRHGHGANSEDAHEIGCRRGEDHAISSAKDHRYHCQLGDRPFMPLATSFDLRPCKSQPSSSCSDEVDSTIERFAHGGLGGLLAGRSSCADDNFLFALGKSNGLVLPSMEAGPPKGGGSAMGRQAGAPDDDMGGETRSLHEDRIESMIAGGLGRNVDSNGSRCSGLRLHLKEAWARCLDKCIDASPLCICRCGQDGGRCVLAIVGSHAGTIGAIDLYSGSYVWRTKLPTRVEASCCAASEGDVVVVGGYDGAIYGLDARHGTWLWRHGFSGAVKASACPLPEHVVLGACWGGSIRALDARTGRLLYWSSVCGPVFATPLFDATRCQVYVADLRGHLSCFVISGGESRAICSPSLGPMSLRWRHTTPSREPPDEGCHPIFSSPTLGQSSGGRGLVIFGCVDAHVYAVDADTGGLMWSFKTDGPVFAAPTVTRGQWPTLSAQRECRTYRAFVASASGHLICLDMTGELLWQQLAKFHGHSSPALDSPAGQIGFTGVGAESYTANMVVVGAVDGTLHIFAATDGSPLTTFRLPGPIFSSCVICAGKIVVGCRDDSLHCVDVLASAGGE